MTLHLAEKDKQQRERALDPRQSFIVQAPAGSGKTELLIQRFLVLLTCVNTPEEILAITFTKKSANEMRARLLKTLKHAATEPEPDSEHKRKTWYLAKKVLERDQTLQWHLLSNPNQLHIKTIDSFCTYLTKQLPLISHFGSSPAIAENPSLLYRDAIKEVLSHIELDVDWANDIAKLLLHLDNDLNKLHDLLVNLLAKRDQWLSYIHLNTSDDAIRTQLETQVALVIEDHLSMLDGLFPPEDESALMDIARYAADNLIFTGRESAITTCQDITSLPPTQASALDTWRGIAQLLLTSTMTWRKRPDEKIGFTSLQSLKNTDEKTWHKGYRQKHADLIEHLTEREDLRQAFANLLLLPNPYYSDAQWDILKALLHVLKIVAAQLRVSFQKYGQIDFIENAQAALSALGNAEHPTDLTLALDYRIQHILIDEFQDTSYTQYHLLEKLTYGWTPNDGRTLFVVGDPMQSIYRFREAEVGLFIRMCTNGIGQCQLEPLTLSLNFRSSPTIVDWNNQHFSAIFPSFTDIATGSISYSPSVTPASTQALAMHSHIDVHGFSATHQQAQSEHIASMITTIQQQHPNDSIAVLVRSRTHLADVIPALKRANLSYRAIDIDPLAARQHIQDLLSLTCALLHPADRIAWLAILRAPWCGLTLADLTAIAGDHPHATIWECLNNTTLQQTLSSDGQQRLHRLLPILTSKLHQREQYDLRYWVESTWYLLGGPACLQEDSDKADAHTYFSLLTQFSQQYPSLNLAKLKELVNKEYASTQHDDTKLQIMTIHTAKGLEFDTVILPHLERKMPYDDKALLTWMERPLSNDSMALLLAPIHATGNEADAIFTYIARQQRIKSDYETDRLFYVATTRAKKRLCLYFTTHVKEDNSLRTESGSMLEKLAPYIDLSVMNTTPTTTSTVVDIKPKRHIARLTDTWINPILEPRSAPLSIHRQKSGFDLPDQHPKWIGTVTHRILQLLTKNQVSWWEQMTPTQRINYISVQLAQLGAHKAKIPASAKFILESLQRMLADERGQWILTAHHDAQSEYAMTAAIDGAIEHLVIDRTFIDAEGTRWIIDYKTATFTHNDLDLFLKKEQEKYLTKMRQYGRALQLLDARPIKLGLYFPALAAWKEWEA